VKVVAFDTETKGLDWWDPDQQAFLASWADESGEYVADLSDDAQAAAFIAVLDAADVLVCHNLPFDTHQVRETLGWDAVTSGKVLHDTHFMSNILDPAGAGMYGVHKLKTLAVKWIDPAAKEAEEHIDAMAKSMGISLKTQGAYYDVWRAYPEIMERYAALDARYTLDLFQLFIERFAADAQAAEVYLLEQRVVPILIEAERIGVALDQDVVAQLTNEYTAQHEIARAEIVETLGPEVVAEKGSEQALLDALKELGVPLYRKTDSGQLATNKYALQEFIADYPIIDTLFEYRQTGKFLSTYLGPMADRDAIHTSIQQIGAWTGRMSSRRPNMQNLPKRAGKEVRGVFVPRPGCCFVVSDYDSIEVRLLAWYLGDEGFRQLIEDGHDPHAWMAAQIHGGTMEEYEKDGPNDDVRSLAKNSLFAITYGAGGGKISDMNQMDPGPWYGEDHPAIIEARANGKWWPMVGWQYREARSLIKKIKSSLPGYGRLTRRIKEKVEASGFVTTIMGRVNPVNPEKAYVGLNALIQGSAADIMKQGLVNVAEAVAPYGGNVLLVVHDEVLTECPIENAEQVLAAQEQALIAAYDLMPSLKVTSSVVTTSYADA